MEVGHYFDGGRILLEKGASSYGGAHSWEERHIKKRKSAY
jgi:hypothetical protein